MNSNKETVIIHLLGKPYPVVCPADDVSRLREAAAYLEQKLHGWVRGNTQMSLDRIALMAGLELAQECLARRADSSSYEDDILEKVRELTSVIDTELC